MMNIEQPTSDIQQPIAKSGEEAGEVAGGLGDPVGIGQGVGAEGFEDAGLGVLQQGAVQAQGGGLGGVDEAGGVVGTHLEQDAQFEFAERFSAEETVRVVQSVADADEVKSQVRSFADDPVQQTAGLDGRTGVVQ